MPLIQTTLLSLLMATGLLAARPCSAQIAYSSAAASVTILPADPAMRPIPAQGLGVRWDKPTMAATKQTRRETSSLLSSRTCSALATGSRPHYNVLVRASTREVFSTYLLQTTTRVYARGSKALMPPVETTVLLLE